MTSEFERLLREAIRIRPGDYVAITLKEPMDPEEIEKLRGRLRDYWPDVKCVIFDHNFNVEVIRPEQPQPKKPSPLAGF